MKVTNEVKVYEVDGVRVPGVSEEALVVRSHGIDKELVVLKFFRESFEVSVTVSAESLRLAVANATNWK